MKYSIVMFSLSAFLISSSLLAKFSGIPIRTEVPEERSEVPEPARIEENFPDQITPHLVASLLNAEKIAEPLKGWEEASLNQIFRLFRRMAARSEQDGRELMGVIYRSRLQKVAKANWSAAVLLGKLDTERRLSEDDIAHLNKIAREAQRLTFDAYQSLDRATKLAYKNTSRSLLDDLRMARKALKENRLRDSESRD